jgi:hypothetical protein
MHGGAGREKKGPPVTIIIKLFPIVTLESSDCAVNVGVYEGMGYFFLKRGQKFYPNLFIKKRIAQSINVKPGYTKKTEDTSDLRVIGNVQRNFQKSSKII